MVFFVCEGCNETLKKNKVDAHAARCRNCWAVSCVDCSVVFEGNDYAAHTSCISEAQKYEGSLYKAKAKKMSPQERWVEVVQTTKAPNDRKLQNVLDRVANYDNAPRKKPKFVNFMKNSIGIADAKTIENVWSVLDETYKQLEAEAAAADAATAPASADATATNGSNKKRPAEDETPSSDEAVVIAKKAKKDEVVVTSKSIKWGKIIKATLKKAPSKQLDLSVLRELVLEHIRSENLSTKGEKELKREFKDALRASDKFETIEMVRLTE